MTFKTIPGTLGWKISEDGVLLDPLGVMRKTYRNGDGYVTAVVQLLDERGTYRTFGLHRLIALAHIECPGDPADYEVNHVDFDIGNNTVSNLEWVTSGQNNVHAALMRGNNDRPTIIGYSPSGSIEYINGLSGAVDKFGCSKEAVWIAIRDGSPIDGWKLQYVTTRTAIPAELHKPKILVRDANGRQSATPVVIKDLESGDVIGYASISDAARDHQVSASHVYQCISTSDKPRLFKKRYLIVQDGDQFPFMTVDEIEEMKSPQGKEVVAFNIREGKYYIFPSASSFIATYHLSKKAVTTVLKERKLRQVDSWLFVYNKEELVSELKATVERPHSL